MNEILRRAMLSAHLDEVDIAVRLEVDPKTVRRWLEGRLPYTRHRWALANLLNLNETDLWPELRTDLSRPDEILSIYPHRSSITQETWRKLFASAEREISIVDYSSLFLAEDAVIIHTLTEKAHSGVRVRIALGSPDRLRISECDVQEPIGDALATEIHEALALYRPLRQIKGVEIRLHRVVLYSSIYRVDSELLCNQHAYGIPNAQSPVLHMQSRSNAGFASTYLSGLERIWGETYGEMPPP